MSWNPFKWFNKTPVEISKAPQEAMKLGFITVHCKNGESFRIRISWIRFEKKELQVCGVVDRTLMVDSATVLDTDCEPIFEHPFAQDVLVTSGDSIVIILGME